jgi:prevent-host-death family protein
MRSVNVHEAKANLSELIKQACLGEDIVIARGTIPVVRLVPVGKVRGRRKPGALRGKLRVGLEFFEPLPSDQLSAWE